MKHNGKLTLADALEIIREEFKEKDPEVTQRIEILMVEGKVFANIALHNQCSCIFCMKAAKFIVEIEEAFRIDRERMHGKLK